MGCGIAESLCQSRDQYHFGLIRHLAAERMRQKNRACCCAMDSGICQMSDDLSLWWSAKFTDAAPITCPARARRRVVRRAFKAMQGARHSAPLRLPQMAAD